MGQIWQQNLNGVNTVINVQMPRGGGLIKLDDSSKVRKKLYCPNFGHKLN